MPYLLIVMEPPGQRAERGLEGGQAAYAAMLAYTEELKARGVLLASSALTAPAHGVRLQLREGRRSVVDGPFAEAKEVVGGFFLVNCASRDEAVALAAECPAAQFATLEIRETGPCYA